MEEGGDSRPMRIGRGQKMDGWMEKVDESKQRQKSSGLLYVGDEAGQEDEKEKQDNDRQTRIVDETAESCKKKKYAL